MPVIIKLQGTAAVRRRLRKTSEALQTENLQSVAEYTRSVAYSLAPKDTGAGARGIAVEVHDKSAEVISRDFYMYVMELGRRRGSAAPPMNALVGWGARHGFVGRQALFLLSRAIGRDGIRAHRFMARAAEAARTKVNTYTKDLVVKINRIWESEQP